LVVVESFFVRTIGRVIVVATIKIPMMIVKIIFNDFFLSPVVILNDQIFSTIIFIHNTYGTSDGTLGIGFVFSTGDVH
jgi:hypothetical protein